MEKRLLTPKVRGEKQNLQELLDENFIEFCSSGKIYIYDSNNDTIEEIKEESDKWSIIEFEIKQLSDDCILATYRLVKWNLERQRESLRSSIWKNSDGKWKMIFHQGTIIRD